MLLPCSTLHFVQRAGLYEILSPSAAALQVAGETEVKAQIKLRIRTAQGAPIVIVRSFQLVQKAKALQVCVSACCISVCADNLSYRGTSNINCCASCASCIVAILLISIGSRSAPST
jgi:hypothetical protein